MTIYIIITAYLLIGFCMNQIFKKSNTSSEFIWDILLWFPTLLIAVILIIKEKLNKL